MLPHNSVENSGVWSDQDVGNFDNLLPLFNTFPVSMLTQPIAGRHFCESDHLEREVVIDMIDFQDPDHKRLLVLNDGQDLERLNFARQASELVKLGTVEPFTLIAIHAGNRKEEYGVSGFPDYAGRGAKAGAYGKFVTEELFDHLEIQSPENVAFMGCSLGALSALDISLSHPEIFSCAGLFSGSFWWRSRSYEDGYTDTDRVFFIKLKDFRVSPEFRCWLMAGTEDERNDRDTNGVIDAVDDTLDLFERLYEVAEVPAHNLQLEVVPGGRHHTDTWKSCLPSFLTFAFPG